MNKSRLLAYWCAATLAIVIGTPSANAQSTMEKAKTLAASAAPGGSQTLLSQIHETNQAEIKVGHLAEEKAATKQVRAFGAELVADHTAADQKVAAIARQLDIQLEPPSNPTKEMEAKVEKHRQLDNTLRSLSGTEFDHQFLTAMVDDHEKNIQMLRGAVKTNPRVRQLVNELLPELEKHKKTASQLLASEKRAASTR
jgi:putative membrane protein